MQTLAEAKDHFQKFAGVKAIAASSTPLAAAATDTTGFIDIRQLARLHGTVFADQGGTLNIHFSGDGVNIDYTRTISVGASDKVNSAWDQLVVAPYVKFEYINGSTIQGAYRFYAFGRSMS